MTPAAWLAAAKADADRRGLPELGPLLDMLADATRALRAAEWNRQTGERAAVDRKHHDEHVD